MENANGEQKFCKKLVWREDNKPEIVLYGIILEESNTHLRFKTARKSYFLNKSFIIKLEDTNRIFRSADLELTDEERLILDAKPSGAQE